MGFADAGSGLCVRGLRQRRLDYAGWAYVGCACAGWTDLGCLAPERNQFTKALVAEERGLPKPTLPGPQ